MATLETKSGKVDRSVETSVPDFILVETLEEASNIAGEDYVLAKAQAQATVDFRAFVRGLLESVDKESGEYRYTEEAIIEKAESWVPALRERKSAAERLAETAGGLSPEQLAEILMKSGQADAVRSLLGG
jgi:hypothetical protein